MSEDKESCTPKRSQVKYEESNIFKILAVASFIMLSALTWALSPLQKAVELTSDKQKLLATGRVCNRVRAMQDVYTEYVSASFLSGCMTQKRNSLVDLAKTEKEKEYIKELFRKRDSLEHEKYKDECNGWVAAYQREGKLKEMIMQDLYDTFECIKVYAEIKKQGYEEEFNESSSD